MKSLAFAEQQKNMPSSDLSTSNKNDMSSLSNNNNTSASKKKSSSGLAGCFGCCEVDNATEKDEISASELRDRK